MKNFIQFILFILLSVDACSQCIDPIFNISACNYQSFSFNGATQTCHSSSCGSGSTYNYTLTSTGIGLTAIAWNINGGTASYISRTSGNNNTFQQDLCNNPLTGPAVFSVNQIQQFTLTVTWTTASPSNKIEFFGYTGVDGSGSNPSTLSYYTYFDVATSDPLVSPTAIYVGSPQCYTTPHGYKLTTSPVTNATSYLWNPSTYCSASGFYGQYSYYYDGPVFSYNQYVNVCVTAKNSCNTASYVTTIYIPSSSCSNGNSIKNPQNLQNENTEFDSQVPFVFENPVRNFLKININKNGNFLVKIISLKGQIIKQVYSGGLGKVSIDVSTLAKGIYLLSILNGSDVIINKKLLIE